MFHNDVIFWLKCAVAKIAFHGNPHDPPEPSCQLFVYNTMSPNAFSEVHKPSVFARVSPLHIYWPLLIVLFSGICKPPKTQTRIWFCVRAETLEPFSVKTKETAVVFAQLVLFSVIRNPVPSQTMAGTQRALTICQYHKIESECFGEESGLPPANSKYIRWHVEVCRASYAL